MLDVRPAEERDVPAVAALHASRRGTPADAMDWAARQTARTRTGDPAGALFVAEADGAFAGYGLAIRFEPPPDAPPNSAPPGYYLGGLVVDPRFRRRGAGRALVAARIAWVGGLAPAVLYFSDDDNLASIRLHAPFGFRPVTRDFWFPGLAHPETPMTLFRLDLAGVRGPAGPGGSRKAV